MTAQVIPYPSGEPERWDSIEIKVPPPMPRIEPGRYQAVSVALTRFSAFKRVNLKLEFDVYRGEIGASEILARIPMFLRMPGPRGLARTAKLAKLLHAAGMRSTRHQRISLDALRGKMWLVEVADTERDTLDGEVPAGARYSVIRQVIERL